MKSTTIALLLLLLICTSEIVHIQAKIEHGRSKISKLNRPRRKNKDDDEDGNDKQDKEDPKECNCWYSIFHQELPSQQKLKMMMKQEF